jgi:hypothetical protein
MDNPEKLAAQVTQDEEKENKTHNTICVRHHYTQTNTNNMSPRLLQTAGGKDEPNICGNYL